VAELRSALADTALLLTDVPDLRLPALQTLASAASTERHFAALAAVGDDPDLAWRVLVRRAELGEYDAEVVRALVDRDPDPEAATRTLAVRAALPDAAAKDEVWRAVFTDRSVHAGSPLTRVAQAFWRPGQEEVLLPFAARYLETVTNLGEGGMLELGSLAGAMQPRTADEAFLTRAREVAEDPETLPIVRTLLLGCVDTLGRQLPARRGGT
jgi:aminopeptidase N